MSAPLVQDLPSVSPSRLQALRECFLRVAFAQSAPAPGPKTDAQLIGDAAHATLAALIRPGPPFEARLASISTDFLAVLEGASEGRPVRRARPAAARLRNVAARAVAVVSEAGEPVELRCERRREGRAGRLNGILDLTVLSPSLTRLWTTRPAMCSTRRANWPDIYRISSLFTAYSSRSERRAGRTGRSSCASEAPLLSGPSIRRRQSASPMRRSVSVSITSSTSAPLRPRALPRRRAGTASLPRDVKRSGQLLIRSGPLTWSQSAGPSCGPSAAPRRNHRVSLRRRGGSRRGDRRPADPRVLLGRGPRTGDPPRSRRSLVRPRRPIECWPLAPNPERRLLTRQQFVGGEDALRCLELLLSDGEHADARVTHSSAIPDSFAPLPANPSREDARVVPGRAAVLRLTDCSPISLSQRSRSGGYGHPARRADAAGPDRRAQLGWVTAVGGAPRRAGGQRHAATTIRAKS